LQVWLPLRRLTAFAAGIESKPSTKDIMFKPFLSVCNTLPDWYSLLKHLSELLQEIRCYQLAILVLERTWELNTDPPTLESLPRLPHILHNLGVISGKLLECGRPQEAHQIYVNMPQKLAFIIQNGGEEFSDMLNTLLVCLQSSEDVHIALRTETLKADLDKVLLNSLPGLDSEILSVRSEEDDIKDISFKINSAITIHQDVPYTDIEACNLENNLSICDKALLWKQDKDCLDRLYILHNKACTLRSLGHLQDAYQICNDVYIKLEQLYGTTHNECLSVAFLRASILEEMHKLNEAQTAYETLYERQVSVKGENDADVMSTKLRIATVLECKGQSEIAMDIYEELLEKQRTTLGIEHPVTLVTMHERAVMLQKQNKLQESLNAFEEIRSIRSLKLGNEHIDTLCTTDKIASILSSLGQHEKALAMFNELIETQKIILGEGHPYTLSSLHNRAVVYENQAQYDIALRHFRNVYSLKMRKHGFSHASTLQTMLAIGRTLSKLQDYNGALEIYDTIIAKKSDVISLDIGAKLGKAAALEEVGKLEDARVEFQNLLTLQISIFGDDHKSVLVTNERIASLFAKEGKYDKSLEIYNDIVEKARLIYGQNHKSTRSVIYNSALTHAQAGNYDEALIQFGDLLGLEIKEPENDRKTIENIKENIAALLDFKCEYAKSHKIYDEILKSHMEISNTKDDPATIKLLSKIGSVLHKQGRTDEAAAVLEDILKNREELTDECLAPLLYSSGHFARAIALLDKTLKDKRQRLGDTHPNVLAVLEAKSAALIGCELYDEAMKILSETVVIKSQTLGENDPSTLATKSRIAAMHAETYNTELAFTNFEEIIELQKKLLGSSHPDTQISLKNRIKILEMRGEYDVALKCQEEFLCDVRMVLGNDHAEVLDIERNIICLIQKTGNSKVALEKINKLITKMGKILGEKHRITMTAKINRASILESYGKPKDALNALQDLIKSTENVCGVNNVDHLAIKSKIACLLTKTGDACKGLDAINEVLALQKKDNTHIHDICNNMFIKADILIQMNRCNEAVKCFEIFLQTQREQYGDKNIEFLSAQSRFVLLLNANGDKKKALILCDKIISQQKNMLGHDHPETLKTMFNKACVLRKQGKCAESVDKFQETLLLSEQRLGKRHSSCTAIRQQLFVLLVESGDYKGAFKIYEDIREEDRTIDVMRSRANALEIQGHIDEALVIYEKVRIQLH
jgi:tetratricopeptide (TPR) repeat protein